MNALVVLNGSRNVFEVLATLTDLQRAAIVRPNNPPPGVAGFLFDLPQNEVVELSSDITPHFVEDNTAVQDQIALPPEQFTLRATQAELAAIQPPPQSVAPQTDALPQNSFFEPALAPQEGQELSAQALAFNASQRAISSAPSLYEFYNAQAAQQPNQTKQSKAFQYFYNLWRGRQLVSVETPWGYFTDMAISTFRAEQGEDTRWSSEFVITFTRMRFVGTAVVAAGQLAGRAAAQSAPVSQNGNAGLKAQTPEQEQSLLYRMMHPTP